MEQKKIERINELARKKKESMLTEEEKKEQAALRAEYLSLIRKNLVGTLEHTSIQKPDGSVHKLRKRDIN